jgi:predicted  nucleic acid-binding Zn-ribbon protein
MKAAAKLQWRKPCANCGHIKTAHDPAKRRTLMPCLECSCTGYVYIDRRNDGLDAGATQSRVGSDHRLG